MAISCYSFWVFIISYPLFYFFVTNYHFFLFRTGIPTNSLDHIAKSIIVANAPMHVLAEFVKIIWFQVVNLLNVPSPRGVVLDIISYLNESTIEMLGNKNENEEFSDDYLTSAQAFIKYSAALACYAYSCPLENISEIDIVPYIGQHVNKIS